MAAFNTVPVEEDPLVEKAATKKTPWRRLVASALVAGMLCAGAALNSKTAAAPTALLGGTAYDGSGVAWDCSAINSYVATSNGISSGSIESAGFSVTGNGQTLKNGKETTYKAGEALTVEVQGQPYAWLIYSTSPDLFFLRATLEVVDSSSSVLMGCENFPMPDPVVNKAPSATPAVARISAWEPMYLRGDVAVTVFTSPNEWYTSTYPLYYTMDSGPWPGYDGASSLSLATAAAVAVAAVVALA